MSMADTRFDVHIPADPRWYHAHFPGQPIVPGVVLLAALQAGCRDALAHLGTLRAVRHLRFLQPVRAPATLQATVQVRGEWLHCALAARAGDDDVAAREAAGATASAAVDAVVLDAAGMDAVAVDAAAGHEVAGDAAPAAAGPARARRGADDVLRAQLQFDAVLDEAADTRSPSTHRAPTEPAG